MRSPLLLAIGLLAACGHGKAPVTLHPADAVPAQLSAWGVASSDGRFLELNDRVYSYELNTPLFSDYARKLRTVWLPPGSSATYHARDEFDFPVGTIVSKTFYYEKAARWSASDRRVKWTEAETLLGPQERLDLSGITLIETRLLVRYSDGWQAFPYVWNDAQDEAWLEIAGDVRPLTLVGDRGERDFLYIVPDTNQCAGCHAPDHSDADIRPIGLKARHLDRDGIDGNQIEHWRRTGVLDTVGTAATPAARWLDPGGATLAERARAYLDINCAHCHNAVGAADTSGLHLDFDAPLDRHFGICKSPTAVGQGSGDRLYDIYPGRADESIMVFRMDHTDPAIAMPELGRSTIHAEGVAVISAWIESLDGEC